jgi:hypothetical protein
VKRVALSIVLLALAGSAWAQAPAEKPTPTPAVKAEKAALVLADADALKLSNYLLTAENLQLKVQALQADLAKVQAALQAFAQEKAQPGYHLERNAQGAFIYVADAPKVAEKPAEPEPAKPSQATPKK